MIYIIYAFDDYPFIKPLVDDLRDALPDTAVFLFEPAHAPRFWHRRAVRHLRKSRLVLVFEPLSGKTTEAGKHISWEIRQAVKQKRRMVTVCREPVGETAIAFEDVTAFVTKECHRLKEDDPYV